MHRRWIQNLVMLSQSTSQSKSCTFWMRWFISKTLDLFEKNISFSNGWTSLLNNLDFNNCDMLWRNYQWKYLTLCKNYYLKIFHVVKILLIKLLTRCKNIWFNMWHFVRNLIKNLTCSRKRDTKSDMLRRIFTKNPARCKNLFQNITRCKIFNWKSDF